MVSNPETGHVLHVAPGFRRDVTMAFYEGLGETYRAAVESVSMDMWPYISATLMIPDAVMDRQHGWTLGTTARSDILTKWQWLKGRSRKAGSVLAPAGPPRPGTSGTSGAEPGRWPDGTGGGLLGSGDPGAITSMRSSSAPPTDRPKASSRIKTVKVRSRGFRNRER